MKTETSNRELFVLNRHGGAIHGTYHKEKHKASMPTNGSEGADKLGVVFLNGLLATRAGSGDAVAHWADACAIQGYPSFRLDLPGYGDSEGGPPDEWLDYVSTGGHVPQAVQSLKEIKVRFNLSMLVVVAQCAGCVTAIGAAAEVEGCRGLILIKPYFYLPQTKMSAMRRQLDNWEHGSKLVKSGIKLLKKIKSIPRSIHGNALPGNANVMLLRRWRDFTRPGSPVLILTAADQYVSTPHLKANNFDYLKHLMDLAGRGNKVQVKSVDDEDHSFTTILARAKVHAYMDEWLGAHFPSLSNAANEVYFGETDLRGSGQITTAMDRTYAK